MEMQAANADALVIHMHIPYEQIVSEGGRRYSGCNQAFLSTDASGEIIPIGNPS